MLAQHKDTISKNKSVVEPTLDSKQQANMDTNNAPTVWAFSFYLQL